MKWVIGIACIGLGIPSAWAAPNHNLTNTSVQVQDQEQGQEQGQFQEQSSDQANTQDASVNVTETHPRQRVLLNGSMAHAVPQGNDGLMAVTPWGGPAITHTSDIQKLDIYCKTLGEAKLDASECIKWMKEEAQPRLFLGISKTSRVCRNWLTGLLCF